MRYVILLALAAIAVVQLDRVVRPGTAGAQAAVAVSALTPGETD
jgi:hypothetical protein